jgi:hypothetical protein
VPGVVGRELPIGRIAGELVGAHRLPGNVVHCALAGYVGNAHAVGHERLEEPAVLGTRFGLLKLAANGTNPLAQLDTEPNRVVPQHLA